MHTSQTQIGYIFTIFFYIQCQQAYRTYSNVILEGLDLYYRLIENAVVISQCIKTFKSKPVRTYCPQEQQSRLVFVYASALIWLFVLEVVRAYVNKADCIWCQSWCLNHCYTALVNEHEQCTVGNRQTEQAVSASDISFVICFYLTPCNRSQTTVFTCICADMTVWNKNNICRASCLQHNSKGLMAAYD